MEIEYKTKELEFEIKIQKIKKESEKLQKRKNISKKI